MKSVISTKAQVIPPFIVMEVLDFRKIKKELDKKKIIY